MSITSVRLKPEVAKPLEELAKKLDRSKSYLINEAVAQYLIQQESEQIKWQQTLEAIDSVQKGRIVDADTVHQWLSSWGKEHEKQPPES